MFNDADLLGLPIRLTVSKRSLEAGGVESKLRHETDRGMVKRQEAVPWVQSKLAELIAPLEAAAEKAPRKAD